MDKQKLVKELVKRLRSDETFKEIAYDREYNIVTVGVNPSKVDTDGDEDLLTEYINQRVRKIGNKIALKNKARYVDRLLAREGYAFSFQPAFVVEGLFTKIAGKCWAIDNPVYAS